MSSGAMPMEDCWQPGGANGKTCILGVGDALAEALPQEKGLLVQVTLLRRILPMKTTIA